MTTSQIGWERIARRKNFNSNFNICLTPTIVNSFPNIEKKKKMFGRSFFLLLRRKTKLSLLLLLFTKSNV